MNNKLKLSLITITTLTTANVNAQTFYQCVRNACPSGQYFDGVTCKSLPTITSPKKCSLGQYSDGKDCYNLCPDGKTWYEGQCYKNTCDITIDKSIDKNVVSNKGVSFKMTNFQYSSCNNRTFLRGTATLNWDDCVTYREAAYGEGCYSYKTTTICCERPF